MNSEKKTVKKVISDKEARELGQKLQEFYLHGYVNKRSALGFSFLKGMVTGLGVFVGGSLAVTLILWILSWFDTYPLVGPIRNTLERSVGN